MQWLIKSRPRRTGLVLAKYPGTDISYRPGDEPHLYRVVFISADSLEPGKSWEERTIHFYARRPGKAVERLISEGCPITADPRRFA